VGKPVTVSSIKVKVQRKAIVKLKVLPKFPAIVATSNFVTVTRVGNTFTFNVDYSILTPGPISDPTTAYIAISDTTAGVYRTVALSSLLTSGLDADLQAIAALTGTGILARTAANTWVLRAITGTANEITVTNGDGVAGVPTISLPAALTFTGKTVTGGSYSGATITTSTFNGNTWTAGTGVLTIAALKTLTVSNTLTLAGTDGTTMTFPTTNATIARTDAANTFTGTQTVGALVASFVNGNQLVTGTWLLNGGAAKTFTFSNTLTVAGTDGTTLTFQGTDTYVGRATTDTLTNKTLTSPTLTTPILGVATATSINKLTITAPATSATLTIPDGVTLTGPAASGTAMTLGNTETVTGPKTFGSVGAVGRLKIAGTTSGALTLDAPAVAGSAAITLPGVTGTLATLAGTEALTNKTFNGNTWTAGTGVLTLGTAKTATISNTLTFTGTDGSTISFGAGGTAAYAGATSTGDANYTILSTDRLVYHTALTAARTDTLPAANSVTAGQIFVVNDFRGVASATFTITLQRAGSDTINGVTSVVAINSQYGAGIFWSDGVSRWTYFPASAGGGSGTVTNVATGAGLSGGPITSTGTLSVDVSYFRSYLSGLTLSTAGSSQVFSIAAGVCADSTNTSLMKLAAFTKTAVGGSTWVVGTGNSVLDTGAYSTNTWYHVFIIQRPDTGLVDVLISLSATSPTMPTNYTLFRRIGSIRSGAVAGQWVLFSQLGDEFLWAVPVADVAGSAIGTTPLTTAITVPTGVQVLAMMRAGISNGTVANTSMLISSLDTTSAAVGTDRSVTAAIAGGAYITGITPTRTNTSAQLRFVADVASSTYFVGTYGWIDRRGRDT
jgi:hypothetical protein